MHTNTISRTALRTWLSGLRLPITGVEALTGQSRNKAWPPALAFESFEADAKQFIGSMTRDDELVDEGRVQRAKVSELRRASELEVQAEQKRADADDELQQRRNQVRQKRKAAERQARQRKVAAEQDKRSAEQKTRRQIDKKAVKAKQAAGRRQSRVAATERKTRLTAIQRESAALRSQRRAVTATKTASKTATALKRKQSQRRAANGR